MSFAPDRSGTGHARHGGDRSNTNLELRLRHTSNLLQPAHSPRATACRNSDGKRAPGHLAKQGPPLLRWALYEAACLASHTRAPDHDFYASVKDRIDHKRATISVARKIARRSHHLLRELGDTAYAVA